MLVSATGLELMGVLDKAGFIRAKPGSGKRYDVVLIVHPAVAVKRLEERIPEDLLNTYNKAQIKNGERSYEVVTGEDAEEEPTPAKVLPMKQKAKR